MRPARNTLLGLMVAAAFAAVMLVHHINWLQYQKTHPEAAPVAERAVPDQSVQSSSLSALELMKNDPPESDDSAGILSLKEDTDAPAKKP